MARPSLSRCLPVSGHAERILQPRERRHASADDPAPSRRSCALEDLAAVATGPEPLRRPSTPRRAEMPPKPPDDALESDSQTARADGSSARRRSAEPAAAPTVSATARQRRIARADRPGRARAVAAARGRVRIGRWRGIEDVVHPFLRLRAAVARRAAAPVDAARRAARAGETHVEVVVVPVPRPDLAQPGAVARLVLAHLHLGAGENEDARDARDRWPPP